MFLCKQHGEQFIAPACVHVRDAVHCGGEPANRVIYVTQDWGCAWDPSDPENTWIFVDQALCGSCAEAFDLHAGEVIAAKGKPMPDGRGCCAECLQARYPKPAQQDADAAVTAP